MKISNKTRKKITGVLIGLLLSVLCVTPAFAAETDVTNRLINLFCSLFLIVLAEVVVVMLLVVLQD